VGYALEGIAYVSGALLIGAGLFLAMRGTFPTWWQGRLLWPLANVTPVVARLQGWAAIAVGASIIGIVFTTVAPATVGGILVLAAFAAYLAGVGLFAFSTWMSRRPV
jgi:hypothetical protein